MDISKQVWAIAELLAINEHVDLVDVEWRSSRRGKSLLRVTIDIQEGVSLDICQHFSKRLSYHLDTKEFAGGAYVLEVSSPGIFCILKNTKDYLRNIGKIVLIKVSNSDQKISEIRGILEKFDEGEGKLSIRLENGGLRSIEIEKVFKARLDPDLFPKTKESKKQKKVKNERR